MAYNVPISLSLQWDCSAIGAAPEMGLVINYTKKNTPGQAMGEGKLTLMLLVANLVDTK